MAPLSYLKKGKGHPLILIHGFPFSKEIWSSFSDLLSNDFEVYMPDLPGFGESPSLPQNFSIDDVAKQLLGWSDEIGLKKPVVIGHSLGGYVGLAMAAKQSFGGLVLFHSTAYPDSDEKKASRSKVLEFIEKNGVHAFTSNFIEPLFADKAHPSIAEIRSIAQKASREAVIGYTIVMRNRPDSQQILKNSEQPVLIIAGQQDGGIPVESIEKQVQLSNRIESHILPDVAHMGMFEKPKKCHEIIRTFILEKVVTK